MKYGIRLYSLFIMGAVSCAHAVKFQVPALTPVMISARSEIALQASAVGIDYAELERKALKGDQESLADIIALHLDGAAGEELDGRKVSILLSAPLEDAVDALSHCEAGYRSGMLYLMQVEFVRANGGSKDAEMEYERRFGSLSPKKIAAESGPRE